MKRKRLNQVCNLLFHFLYLYKISINFCANRIVLKFLEWFGLALNTASIETPSVGTTSVGTTSVGTS